MAAPVRAQPVPKEPDSPPLATFPAGEGLVRARRDLKPNKPWGWQQYVLLGVGGVLVLALMIATFVFVSLLPTMVPDAPPEKDQYVALVRNKQNRDEKVFKLNLPPGAWEPDQELKVGLGVMTAMRHVQQDAWFAITAEDFGTRNPRSAELVNLGIDKLTKFYNLSLELGEKAESATFVGEAAHRLEFKGQHKNVAHRGELYMVAHQGFGYWFLIAAPTLPEAQQAMTDMQSPGKGFSFFTERRGWREQPPRRETYTGRKFPYTLTALADGWESFPPLDEDERGDMFLLGRYFKEKDNRKNASVLTLLLEKQENLKDGMKLARTYVEGKKQEEDKTFRFVPAEGGELGRTADVGNKRGQIAEFKILLGDEPVRYLLLAVVNDPGYLFVWRAECRWEHRQIWQQDFLDLLATLKLPKSE